MDARERGSRGGGSGADARPRTGAGVAGTGRSPVRDHPGLYIIQEPETPEPRKVPRLLGRPSRGGPEVGPALRPQTRESSWRNLMRWLAKHSAGDRVA